MAFDAFVKMTGIQGESKDGSFSNQIEIQSYGVGVTQNKSSTVSSSGGASTERADFHDFSFTKLMDLASPKLIEACAAGKSIPEVVVTLNRAGSTKFSFCEYRMTNCFVSGISAGGGSAEDFPTEEVHINYGTFDVVYTAQDRATGASKGNSSAGWDLQKNQKR